MNENEGLSITLFFPQNVLDERDDANGMFCNHVE